MVVLTDQTQMTPMKEAYMSGHKGSYVIYVLF